MNVTQRFAVSVAVLVMVVAVVPAQALPASSHGSSASFAIFRSGVFQSGVIFELNQIRRSHGLVPLKLSGALSASALEHSREMLADGYFAHNSANGLAFWKRIERYYPVSQYSDWSVGENLLWSGAPLDVKEAVDLWMASPEHRANILTPGWREIGVAALYEADAPGVFDGYSVTLVATDFGARN